MPTSVAARDALEERFDALLTLGPRVHGTTRADATVAFVERELAAAGLETRRQAFDVPGWHVDGPVHVDVLRPERCALPAQTMLLSAGTAPGVTVEGVVEDLGTLGLWGGQHAWRRFALVDPEGRAVAYVCGRTNGAAIPQLLPAGAAPVPHVVIGDDDTARLSAWLQRSEAVHLSVSAPAAHGPAVTGYNVHATVPGTTTDGKRIVLVAHYDSVWTTVGAYDNASGVVTVLEVAHRLAREPIDQTVDVLLTGGEELGLLGASAFVASAGATLDAVDFVLNVDGLGRGDLLDVWAGPEALEWHVAQEIRAFAPELRLRSTFPPLPGSDHAPFYAAGVPVAMLTIDDQDVLHSERDLANAEVVANMRRATDLVEHLLRTLAGGSAR